MHPTATLGADRGIPSIAVLPFTNMSGDAEQEFFAEGIAEDISTTLSKISNLLVIARNSTFAYKGRSVDVQTIGRELNVRYVLEGSVRKSGDRVRITTQLVEAVTREHIWAARFDRKLSDIFALQDEITSNVVTALHVRLVEGEQARIWQRATRNINAWECLMHGLKHFRRFNREDNDRARVLFRKALELDPDYASALVWLAWTYWTDARFLWTGAPKEAIDRASELARRALALNDSLADCYSLLGAISLTQRSYDEAIAYGERAVAIEPNGADATALLAMTLNWCERPRQASELVKKAMRLSPIYPSWYLSVLGHAYRLVGRYDDAVAAYKEHIARDPDQLAPHLGLTICLIHAGQKEAAQAQAKEILRISPGFNLAKYAESLTYRNPDDTKRSVEALIEAGIPAPTPNAAQ